MKIEYTDLCVLTCLFVYLLVVSFHFQHNCAASSVCVSHTHTLFLHTTDRNRVFLPDLSLLDIGFIPILKLVCLLFVASREREQLHENQFSFAICNAKAILLTSFNGKLKVNRRKRFSNMCVACKRFKLTWSLKSDIYSMLFLLWNLRAHWCEHRRLEIWMIMMMMVLVMSVHRLHEDKIYGKRWEEKVWHFFIRWFASNVCVRWFSLVINGINWKKHYPHLNVFMLHCEFVVSKTISRICFECCIVAVANAAVTCILSFCLSMVSLKTEFIARFYAY